MGPPQSESCARARRGQLNGCSRLSLRLLSQPANGDNGGNRGVLSAASAGCRARPRAIYSLRYGPRAHEVHALPLAATRNRKRTLRGGAPAVDGVAAFYRYRYRAHVLSLVHIYTIGILFFYTTYTTWRLSRKETLIFLILRNQTYAVTLYNCTAVRISVYSLYSCSTGCRRGKFVLGSVGNVCARTVAP